MKNKRKMAIFQIKLNTYFLRIFSNITPVTKYMRDLPDQLLAFQTK
jgi:hypothetical protein